MGFWDWFRPRKPAKPRGYSLKEKNNVKDNEKSKEEKRDK